MLNFIVNLIEYSVGRLLCQALNRKLSRPSDPLRLMKFTSPLSDFVVHLVESFVGRWVCSLRQRVIDRTPVKRLRFFPDCA